MGYGSRRIEVGLLDRSIIPRLDIKYEVWTHIVREGYIQMHRIECVEEARWKTGELAKRVKW